MKEKYLAGLLFFLLAANLLGGCDGQPEKFMVSGLVESEGLGLAEVKISYQGAISGSTMTDTQGKWNAPLHGSVTITPVKEGYSFSPSSVDLVVDREKTGIDFTATPAIEDTFYTLIIKIWGSGMVSPSSGEKYEAGSAVTITVDPDPGWFFWQWDGPDADKIDHISGNNFKIIMNKDMEIRAQFGQDETIPGIGFPVYWNRQAKGQRKTCGECYWYWPNNYNWSQSKVQGPCPCGEVPNAILEPSNWTIDDAPDTGTHRVFIGAGNEVSLDMSSEIHSLYNEGLMKTIMGRGLTMTAGGLENYGVIELAINSKLDLNIGLLNTDLIEVGCGGGISLKGPLVNSGKIVMEGPQARGTTLLLKGDVHLIGEGIIELTDHRFVIIDSLNGGRLVNEDNIIHGSGEIGWSSLELTNRGKIQADMSGSTLTVRPGMSSINDNLFLATGGGILRLSGEIGGNLDNTWGIIRAEDNSSVKLAKEVKITGGLLESTGNGHFFTHLHPQATLVDLTFRGNFDVGRGATINLKGVIDNQGIIDIPAEGGMAATLYLAEDTTLTGGGDIKLGTAFFGRIDSKEGRLLINEDNVIQGCGEIGWTDLQLINLGEILANKEDEVLTVRPGASATTENKGLMQAEEGGILRLSGIKGGFLDNSWGVIKATEESHVMVAQEIIIKGGLLQTTETGRFFTDQHPQATLVDLTLQGNFDLGPEATINLKGVIDNKGIIDISAEGGMPAVLNLITDITLKGGGKVQMGNEFFARVTGDEDLLKLTIADQTISGEGQLGYGKLVIINKGEIAATNVGRSIRITPYIEEPFVNRGKVRVEAGAIVFVEGDLIQEFEGELKVKLGLADEEEIHGKLQVVGNSDLNGTICIELIDAFMPKIGSEFQILELDFENINGEFNQINLPDLTEGQWDLTQLLTTGIIKVVDL